MTDSEWRECRNPNKLLAFLRQSGKSTVRKARLFGSSCCRYIWDMFTDERSHQAVEVVEKYADGLASRAEMKKARAAASLARDMAFGPQSDAPRQHRTRVGRCTSWAAYALTNVPRGADTLQDVWADVQESAGWALDAAKGRVREFRMAQAELLRDIFGPLAFRSVHFGPVWLTATAVSLAETAYESRSLPDGHLDHERFAVLADALQEAGCEDLSVLGHLRQEGAAHVRGCWCVDLLLKKK